ncbi:winged helix-turn-helix domain-containing protein [Demequina zhanjiangensis]|uniref:Crosslink repair DNA glycosylase YcaQ family protein n=1 Tax=Demequina zhanjiangensis TaxID=3051659 RepID=A0ABT8FXA6_9MICO|nr:crosslink repair DNA glycosylase YcaQ family protein [Demequina sp. SYSU T00b26]MDN4471452.1 crosslink repair DNA glycosylase YcaQ family protein [Demequina sp. SYSU T00b26]
MTESMTAAEARRTFLHAQGLARRRPSRRPRDADFKAYLDTQGVLQLDTVNVLARAHYMPLFSRLGPYTQDALDAYLWGVPDGHGAHTFEHWGHEASVMPRDLLPAMHHRMRGGSSWKASTFQRLEHERPGLLAQVRDAVEESGPVTAGDLEHLAPKEGPRGAWWDATHVKVALEYLFITGTVAASRGRHFTRTYDSPLRAWDLPPAGGIDREHREDDAAWGLGQAEARQLLFDRALAATGIGTVKDLCDHFRLPYQAGSREPDVAGGQAWAASAVERGLARWVHVDGWQEPALLAVDGADAPAWHRAASDPGRATGAALLSPFDPVAWFRPRLLRMFGMDYRIEIYTPEHKRVYGYYCLPFLLGDQMVGRVDLKADRKAGALLVQAAWREEQTVRGARRRSDEEIAVALDQELAVMAGWLGLDEVRIAPRGNLAPALASTAATR